MTNSSKKDSEKKAAREILDSNLDARLDQATSTLSLDDEPPSGDAIDVMLKRAKKVLDAQLPTDELQEIPAKPESTSEESSGDETPVTDLEETNKLVSFNETLAKIEEDIAALHTEKTTEDFELLDTPEETAAMDALLDGVVGDIPTFTVDNILDEVVELDNPLESNDIDDLLEGANEAEIPPILEDEVIEDLVGFKSQVERNEIFDLLNSTTESDFSTLDDDELFEDIDELEAPIERITKSRSFK